MRDEVDDMFAVPPWGKMGHGPPANADDEEWEGGIDLGRVPTAAEMFEAIFSDDPPPAAANDGDEAPVDGAPDRGRGRVAMARETLRGPRRTAADRRAMRVGIARLLHPASVGHEGFVADLAGLNARIDEMFCHLRGPPDDPA